MADFLLGMMNATTRHGGLEPELSARHQPWAASSTTISRCAEPHFEPGDPLRDRHDSGDRYNHMTNFVPELGKVVLAFDDPSVTGVMAAAGLQDRVTYADAVGLPRSLVYTRLQQLRPARGLRLDALERPQDGAPRRLRNLLYRLAVESVPQQPAEHVPVFADGDLYAHASPRPGSGDAEQSVPGGAPGGRRHQHQRRLSRSTRPPDICRVRISPWSAISAAAWRSKSDTPDRKARTWAG